MCDKIIVSDKQLFRSLKTSELIQLRPEVPEWQRFLTTERVNEIYNSLADQIRQGNKQPVLTSCLVICELSNTYKLIDGHHRFRALVKIYEDFNYDLLVVCNIIKCESNNECKHYFKVTNETLPLEVPEQIDFLTVGKNIAQHFYNLYPLCFSSSKNPRRPHLNMDTLSQKLANSMSQTLWTKSEWITKISQLNETCLKYPLSQFVYPGDKIQTVDAALKSTKKKGNFVLGMLKYDWIDLLVTPTQQLTKHTNKTKIPQSLKVSVWNKEFGADSRKGKCYVCGEEIKMENFDCSHVVAESRGGPTNLQNLRCCCRTCNVSCGTTNLDEFKARF